LKKQSKKAAKFVALGNLALTFKKKKGKIEKLATFINLPVSLTSKNCLLSRNW
jgi:hypothetical protein